MKKTTPYDRKIYYAFYHDICTELDIIDRMRKMFRSSNNNYVLKYKDDDELVKTIKEEYGQN